jgi:hypothetical protein
MKCPSAALRAIFAPPGANCLRQISKSQNWDLFSASLISSLGGKKYEAANDAPKTNCREDNPDQRPEFLSPLPLRFARKQLLAQIS